MERESLAFESAASAARLMSAGEVSAAELTELQLARIAAFDPELGSYVLVTAERAAEDARRADAAPRERRGPLHGVPIGLKDLFDTAGIVTAAGAKVLAGRVPERDAAGTERMAAAGTVLLGKQNMHEFAYGLTTTNVHTGTTCNPWNREHVPGGSSGGTAAALAAGLCYLGLGSNTGGSIRLPAAACGIVGLKPTFGRVSRRGAWPLSWSLDHMGPMARTVEDVALALEALAGHDPEDRWSAREGAGGFTAQLEAGAQGLRVGVPRSWFFDDLQPEVARAMEQAIAIFARLGASVTELEVAHLEHVYTAFHPIIAAEASAWHEPWLRTQPQDYGELTRRALEMGFAISAVDHVNARRMQGVLRAEFAERMREIDVLLVPSAPRTAPRIGEPISREPKEAWNRCLVPFNLTGQPAISVPAGFDDAGLPIGLQLAGRPFEEEAVLRAARAWERETEWSARRPELPAAPARR
jgi:aspartyl-tRNA(Asn)/glutamyl-tRNA(Gln) amidotransferase subunit A